MSIFLHFLFTFVKMSNLDYIYDYLLCIYLLRDGWLATLGSVDTYIDAVLFLTAWRRCRTAVFSKCKSDVHH